MIRAYLSTVGVCLNFRESISNAGTQGSFGTVRPSGKAVRKTGKVVRGFYTRGDHMQRL